MSSHRCLLMTWASRGYSVVVNQRAFGELRTVEKNKHVTLLRREFRVRKSLSAKVFFQKSSAISARHSVSIRHSSCSEWVRPYENSCSCFGQSAVAREWISTVVMFCLTTYRLTEAKLHGFRRLCRQFQHKKECTTIWISCMQSISQSFSIRKSLCFPLSLGKVL